MIELERPQGGGGAKSLGPRLSGTGGQAGFYARAGKTVAFDALRRH